MSHVYNRKLARLKVIKAIRYGKNSDEAVEAAFLPEAVYGPVRGTLLKQLASTLKELAADGLIEREASHGLWIMTAKGDEGYRGVGNWKERDR